MFSSKLASHSLPHRPPRDEVRAAGSDGADAGLRIGDGQDRVRDVWRVLRLRQAGAFSRTFGARLAQGS